MHKKRKPYIKGEKTVGSNESDVLSYYTVTKTDARKFNPDKDVGRGAPLTRTGSVEIIDAVLYIKHVYVLMNQHPWGRST